MTNECDVALHEVCSATVTRVDSIGLTVGALTKVEFAVLETCVRVLLDDSFDLLQRELVFMCSFHVVDDEQQSFVGEHVRAEC